MRNAHIAAIMIIILATLWIGGNIIFKGSQVSEQGGTVADGQQVNDPTVIMKKSVAEDIYRNLRLFGQTSANRAITIVAKTSGEIEEIMFERGQSLKAGDVMVRLSQDNRPLELKQAEANLKDAKAQYDSIQKLVEQKYRSSNQLVAAEAQVAIAEASLERIRLDIGYTEIKAPFSGYVDENLVDLGSYVTVGTSITQFLELNPLKVVVNVSENLVAYVDREAEAIVQINEEKVKAKIANISHQADANTRTFAVEVILDNPNGQYSAGQTAIVLLPIQKVKAHLISPAFISLDDMGRFGIKTVGNEGLVEFYPAILIDDTPEGMWITGLPGEVNMITQGAAYVSEGQKVNAFYSQEEAHQAAVGNTETGTQGE